MDSEDQRQLQLMQLFLSPGWSIFEERIKDLRDYEQSAIDLLTGELVSPDSLAKLNDHVSKRNSYRQILLLAEELKEELAESKGA